MSISDKLRKNVTLTITKQELETIEKHLEKNPLISFAPLVRHALMVYIENENKPEEKDFSGGFD
jgi:hypothetical protein